MEPRPTNDHLSQKNRLQQTTIPRKRPQKTTKPLNTNYCYLKTKPTQHDETHETPSTTFFPTKKSQSPVRYPLFLGVLSKTSPQKQVKSDFFRFSPRIFLTRGFCLDLPAPTGPRKQRRLQDVHMPRALRSLQSKVVRSVSCGEHHVGAISEACSCWAKPFFFGLCGDFIFVFSSFCFFWECSRDLSWENKPPPHPPASADWTAKSCLGTVAPAQALTWLFFLDCLFGRI